MCFGGKTQQVTQTNQPPQQVMQAYQNLINLGSQVAQQPLQQYTSPMVAGFSDLQNQAFQELANMQGMGTPYTNAASQYIGQGAAPINANLLSPDTLQSLAQTGFSGITQGMGGTSLLPSQSDMSTLPGQGVGLLGQSAQGLGSQIYQMNPAQLSGMGSGALGLNAASGQNVAQNSPQVDPSLLGGLPGQAIGLNTASSQNLLQNIPQMSNAALNQVAGQGLGLLSGAGQGVMGNVPFMGSQGANAALGQGLNYAGQAGQNINSQIAQLNPYLMGGLPGNSLGLLGSSTQSIAGQTPQMSAGQLGQLPGQGISYAQQAAQNIASQLPQYNAQTMSQYQDPYTQQVIGSALDWMNNQNAQQQQQLIGNQISQGAFGGDRGKIAQAELAGQQDMAKNQTIANLLSQGFQGAQGALAQQQQIQSQALQAGQGLAGQTASQLLGLFGQQQGLASQNAAQTAALRQQAAQQQLGLFTGQQGLQSQNAATTQGLQAQLAAQLQNLYGQQGQLGLQGNVAGQNLAQSAAQQMLGLYGQQQQLGLQGGAQTAALQQQAANNLYNMFSGQQQFGANTAAQTQALQQGAAGQLFNALLGQQGLGLNAAQGSQALQQSAGNSLLNFYGGQQNVGLQNAGLAMQGGNSLANIMQGQQGMGLQQGAVNAQSALNAGQLMGNLGTTAQNQALEGAGSLLNAGGAQQALAQQQLNVPYEQFLQQQQYPFQTAQWLAGLINGTGSQMGGTSTSTQPGPSMISQLAGLGLTAGGLSQAGVFGAGGLGGLLGIGGSAAGTAASAAGAGSFVSDLLPLIGLAKDGGRIERKDGGTVAAPQLSQFSRDTIAPPVLDQAAFTAPPQAGSSALNYFNPLQQITPQSLVPQGQPYYQSMPLPSSIANLMGQMGTYKSGQSAPSGPIQSLTDILNARQGNPLPVGNGTTPITPVNWQSTGTGKGTNAALGPWGAIANAIFNKKYGGALRRADGGDTDDDDDSMSPDDDSDDQGMPVAMPQSPQTPTMPSGGLAAGAANDNAQAATGTQGLAASAQPQAQAAAPSTWDKIASNPLVYAGLGMMSGQSPFALTNIGQGALMGLQAYQQQQQTKAMMQYREQMAQLRQAHEEAYQEKLNEPAIDHSPDGSSYLVYKNEKDKDGKPHIVPLLGPSPLLQKRIDLEEQRVGLEGQRVGLEGQRLSQSGATPVLSDQDLDYVADQYRLTGQMPPLGMGQKAANMRAQILSRAAERDRAQGVSGEEAVGVHAETKANALSLNQVTKYASMVNSFENTANQNADLALQLAGKGAAKTGIPILNSWIQAGRKRVAGDPDIVSFDAALTTFKNEYAKIMSGATGAQGSTDSARREADELIDRAMTPEQLQSTIATMRQEMKNRSSSLAQQQQDLRASLAHRGNVAPASDGVAQPRSKQEFDSLPHGAHYRKPGDPLGSFRVKQ